MVYELRLFPKFLLNFVFWNTIYGIFEYFNYKNMSQYYLKHLKFSRRFNLYLNHCQSKISNSEKNISQ